MADTVINAGQVIADFGSYYIDNGQNLSDLYMRPYVEFETKDAFTIVPTTDTILRHQNVNVGEILQSYQDDFTPKGLVSFAGSVTPLYQMKIDQAFNPTKLMATWLGFLTADKLDRKTWPFVRWFIEEYIFKKQDEDLETKAIYGGKYVPPTQGVPNNAADTMNGIKELLNSRITAGGVIPIVTGTPSNDPATWTQQLEAFAGSLPEKYWKNKLTLNMSPKLALRNRKGRKKLYNENYSQIAELDTIEDFPGIRIQPRTSMIGSKKIWMTPKENAILAVKGFENKNVVELESVDRKVKIWTDWWMGAGFILDELIWTNDQDLPV